MFKESEESLIHNVTQYENKIESAAFDVILK